MAFVDKIVLGQVCLLYFGLDPVSAIPPMRHNNPHFIHAKPSVTAGFPNNSRQTVKVLPATAQQRKTVLS
jgi:hypothetical protein